MAAKKSPDAYSHRAALEFNCHGIILSAEDAAAVFALLCRGEPVNRTWNTDAPYKPATSSSDMPTLRPITVGHYAALHLEAE